MIRISQKTLIATSALGSWGAIHYPSTGGIVALVGAALVLLWDLLS